MVERITSMDRFNDEVLGSIPGSGIFFFVYSLFCRSFVIPQQEIFGGYEVLHSYAWFPC